MENREYIIDNVKTQFDRYRKLKKWIPFIEYCENSRLKQKCQQLVIIQRVIERAVQIGNFRRAYVYIAVLKTILDDLEETSETIQENLTTILLKN